MRGGRDRGVYRVEALAKGLRILSLFSEERPVQRLKDLADLSGLPLPTVFRLVSTLEEFGYLTRSPDGNWTPGLAVLELGYAALRTDNLTHAAAAPLQRLSDDLQCTVNMGILHGDEALYIVRFRNEVGLFSSNIQVGSMLPAVCTSIGKMLLAHLTPTELRATVSASSFKKPMGPNAIRDLPELRKALEKIQRQGYAVQDEEAAKGMRSISGPVHDATGNVVAAVSVAINATELTIGDIVKRFKTPTLGACQEISRRLGYMSKPAEDAAT